MYLKKLCSEILVHLYQSYIHFVYLFSSQTFLHNKVLIKMLFSFFTRQKSNAVVYRRWKKNRHNNSYLKWRKMRLYWLHSPQSIKHLFAFHIFKSCLFSCSMMMLDVSRLFRVKIYGVPGLRLSIDTINT